MNLSADLLTSPTTAANLDALDAYIANRLADESFGPLEGIVREHLSTGGKRVRAAFVFAAARSLLVPEVQAIPVAAALELLHNATLVHDDLQDGDTVRRGQPTVWVQHGRNQAINAGDMMLMLPYVVLGQAPMPADVRAALMSRLASRAVHTACGQALEERFRDADVILWDAYLASCRGKTGAFFAYPAEAAALLAGQDASQARALGDAATPLGVLFQIQDDVVDLYGAKGRKQPGNDIREGKPSALVVAHAELQPRDAAWVHAVLMKTRGETTDAEVDELRCRFVDDGALELVSQRAEDLFEEMEYSAALAAQPALRKVVLALGRWCLVQIDRCRADASALRAASA